jgi:predicted HAD superfamily Cof-like phosphohydrolase
MEELIKKVKDFHSSFKVEDTQNFEKNRDIFKLRYELMKEENDEYVQACVMGDKIEIADALGDQLYVLVGTIIAHGLEDKIEDIFNEIHLSNMSKLGEDGKPVYREDGKILKGPKFFRPDLTKIMDNE